MLCIDFTNTIQSGLKENACESFGKYQVFVIARISINSYLTFRALMIEILFVMWKLSLTIKVTN